MELSITKLQSTQSWWGHSKRTQKAAWRDLHWPSGTICTPKRILMAPDKTLKENRSRNVQEHWSGAGRTGRKRPSLTNVIRGRNARLRKTPLCKHQCHSWFHKDRYHDSWRRGCPQDDWQVTYWRDPHNRERCQTRPSRSPQSQDPRQMAPACSPCSRSSMRQSESHGKETWPIQSLAVLQDSRVHSLPMCHCSEG